MSESATPPPDEVSPLAAGSAASPISAIEEEIRRQLIAERAAAITTGAQQRAAATPRPVPIGTSHWKGSGDSPGLIARWRNRGGILGGLASLLAILFKLKGLLVAFKFFWIFKTILITGGSMALSMWAYAQYYRWPFAVAMVLMIFLHECGHAFAGHLRGKPWGMMMFVPMMGAFVTVRGGKDAAEDAFIGIAGPIAGTLCGLAAWAAYGVTHEMFWLAVAGWTFTINLFNLAPIAPLDGGWIVPLFSPRILAITAILLIPLSFLNPLILLLALLSLPRIIAGWNVGKASRVAVSGPQPASGTAEQPWSLQEKTANPATPRPPSGDRTDATAYFTVTRQDQWRYGIAYVGLLLLLTLCMYLSGGRSHLGAERAPITPVQISL